MTQRKDITCIRHMLDHAIEAVEMADRHNRSELDTDRKLNLALVRLVEIIGEAAARVSSEIQSKHPNIPWAEIVAMRNRMIHGYDQVDFDILWDVIELHLPPLIEQLRDIVDSKP